MIVESLSLRNWRAYRGLHRFDFAPGLNLLCGPNEAGKSTLFEALVRAFFDRHTSKASEVRVMRPLGSSLGPEVEVIFTVEGVRYRINKRFLSDPMSELYRERGGEFELDHEGDRSDSEILSLLGGGASRGSSRAEHRGLAQALWYLQRESAVPERAWSQALREGLTGLVELALRSPEEERLRKRIEEEYRLHFTASGRLSRRSERFQLEEALPRLAEEIGRRRQELLRANQFRQELTELATQLAELGGRKLLLQKRRSSLLQTRSVGEALEKERAKKEGDLEATKARHLNHKKSLHAYRLRVERIHRSKKALVKNHNLRSQLDAEVRQLRRAAERHARRWERELQPQLEKVEAQLEELKSRQHLEQLEREAELLESIVRRRRELNDRLRQCRAELKVLQVPDEDRWRSIARAYAERERLEAQLQVGAIRVRFSGTHAKSSLPEAELDSESEEFLVTEETRFELASGGAVTVRGGGDTLRQLRTSLDKVEGTLAQTFSEFDVAGVEGLERRMVTARERAAESNTLRQRLAEVDREHRQPEDRLREVSRQITALRGRAPQATLPGIEGWALERTLEQIEEIEAEKVRVQESIRSERETEQKAQHDCLKRNAQLLEVGQQTSKLESQIESLSEENRSELLAYGSLEELELRCDSTATRLAEMEQEHELWVARYNETVVLPRQELQAVEAQLEALVSEEQRLGSESTDRLARIEEVAALGLYDELCRLEAEQELSERRLEAVVRQSEAARLLHLSVEALCRERSFALAGPITELVDRWLRHLTDSRYEEIALDDKLMPTGVSSPDREQTLALESLSYGTHEQVAVLLRLAIGVLLSREERQLVVLDDRLVNADPERMLRLLEILEEASGHCQLLIATCREELYRPIKGARVLQVPTSPTPASPAPEPMAQQLAAGGSGEARFLAQREQDPDG